jgi:hypothetical protein
VQLATQRKQEEEAQMPFRPHLGRTPASIDLVRRPRAQCSGADGGVQSSDQRIHSRLYDVGMASIRMKKAAVQESLTVPDGPHAPTVSPKAARLVRTVRCPIRRVVGVVLTARQPGAVFDRLYTHGMDLHQRRRTPASPTPGAVPSSAPSTPRSAPRPASARAAAAAAAPRTPLTPRSGAGAGAAPRTPHTPAAAGPKAPVTPRSAPAAPRPAAVTPKPAAVTPRVAAVTPKPRAAAVTPKPAAVTPKPAAVTPKPAAVTPKPRPPTAPVSAPRGVWPAAVCCCARADVWRAVTTPRGAVPRVQAFGSPRTTHLTSAGSPPPAAKPASPAPDLKITDDSEEY